MQLQSRNLKLNMRGGDVALLQTELRQLGFDIVDLDGFFGSTTFLAVQTFQRQHEVDPANGTVDKETARLINKAVDELVVERRVVLGNVLREDGSPMMRTRMRAFDRGIREDRLLGETRTDEAGSYEITYDPNEEAICLIVRAFEQNGTELAASDVIFGAQPVETVDLVVGERLRGPSEFARLETRLLSTLEEEGVDASSLDEEDVLFLARKRKLVPRHLASYVASVRLAEETGLATEEHYALVRQGFPVTLTALVAQSVDVLRDALEQAVQANIVAPALEERIPEILDALRAQIVRLALREPEPDRPTLGGLLDIARVPQERQRSLVETYLAHEGPVEGFWRELRERPDMPDEEVDDILYAVKAAALALNHQPLVRELFQMRREGTLGRGLRDLSRLSEEDWREIIGREVNGEIVGAPALLGEDEARTERYATFLPRMVEAFFPTAVLARRLRQNGEPELEPALRFLDENPDFDFRIARLHEYLEAHPEAMNGSADRTATLHQLRRLQRLFDITPHFDKAQAVSALLADGLDSAVAIRRRGPAYFVRTKAEAFGSVEAAGQAYARAARKADAALLLLSQTNAFNPVHIDAVLQNPFSTGIPDLDTLFGSLDMCTCEHCASVLSPAAYLVDILHFLSNRASTTPGESALEVLFDRRPELGEIDLNCQNTSTPLPYIDLLNELLENAVARSSEVYQTTWTAEELQAAPEHRNDEAYVFLANAVFPWSLPFSLPHEEAWRYLNQLGVERYEIMEAFQRRRPTAFSSGPVPTDLAIAADQLHLTPADSAIITGEPLEEHTLQSFWGSPGVTVASLRDALLSIPSFLQRSGFSYAELLQVRLLRFIRISGGLSLGPGDPLCDLANAEFLEEIDVSVLDAVHRFERLRRKLGWSFYDLDRTITALQPGQLDERLIIHIAHIERLRKRLAVPLVEMLSWWSLIDTMTYAPAGSAPSPSLYEQLFQNKVAFDEATLQVFALTESGAELDDPSQDLESHLSSLAAVLSLSTDDVLAIIEDLPGSLNLQTISRLYRHASLARALKLPIRDFLTLKQLSGRDPFENPAETLRLMAVLDKVRACELDLPLLLFLLWHRELPGGQAGPPDATVAATLGALRDGLQAIREETTRPAELVASEEADASVGQPSAGPFEAFTQSKLGQLLPEPDVERTLALIRGVPVDDGAVDVETFITDRLSFLDTADALNALVGQNGIAPELEETQLIQRFEFVLTPLLDHLRRVLSVNLVIQTFAAEFDLAVRAAELLLTEVLASTQDDGQPLIHDLLQEDFIASIEEEENEQGADDLTPEAFPAPFAGYMRLWKVAVLITALDIAPDELEWLHAHGTQLELLDLNALPVGPLEEAPPDLFPDLERLIDLVQLRDVLPPGEPTLFEMLALALSFDPQEHEADEAERQFIDLLHERTGWNLADLEFLAGRETLFFPLQRGLNLAFPEDYLNGEAIRRLRTGIKHLTLLGVSAREVRQNWISSQLTGEATRSIKAAVKAKFDERQWLSVAQSVNDELREKQRGALVAHLVAREPNFSSAADLHEHFLIDPEMSACMLTSRIKQANSSVQLFVQRTLLGLESAVTFTRGDAKEWEWMKLYRVWEANRKVFLWPENWILPELRDDKTPFFRDLESGLLQDELNEATVEREYLKYLNKLNDVAQLEISGLYHEQEPDREVLHVIGRTFNTPHIHYYRRWIDQEYWTPWERVDADIEGDHLMPVVWNRRLYLFWPSFMDKAKEAVVSENAHEEEKAPKRYYEIKIAWSEYREGKWSPKKISNAEITSGSFPRKDFSFWSQFDDAGRLLILGDIYTDNASSDDNAAKDSLALIDQFRFNICSGNLENSRWNEQQERWETFTPEPYDILEFVEGTRRYFNLLRQKPSVSSLRLTTDGEVIGVFAPVPGGRSALMLHPDTVETRIVLAKTPGRAHVITSHSERPLRSRLPFFFQDRSHTFVVVPRRGLVGLVGVEGVEPPGIDPVPMELPDMIINAMGAERRRRVPNRSMVDPATGIVARRSSVLLNEATESAETGVTLAFNGAALDTILNPIPSTTSPLLPTQLETKSFRFENFYHPYVCLLVEQLNRHGIDGILAPDPEQEPSKARRPLVKNLRQQHLSRTFFEETYDPEEIVVSRPTDEFDFLPGGAYSIYNWELFFHAPLLIASRLSADQRFAEAKRWLEYIFNPTYVPDDPTNEPVPERFWGVKPFVEQGKGLWIQDLLLLLQSPGLTAEQKKRRKALIDQIEAWRKDPFKPHLVARLRPDAYMKAVVTAYLDNLIAWADHLFRRDTIESINEATQLYMLAATILGERPVDIPAPEGVRTIAGEKVSTFNDLRDRLDAFGNTLVELEAVLYPMDSGSGAGDGGGVSSSIGSMVGNLGGDDFDPGFAIGDDGGRGGFTPDIPFVSPDSGDGVGPGGLDFPLGTPVPSILGPTLFFCVPRNEKLLHYWDVVEDRLFKIRHCMNIEGVVRQLVLFEAPIDPGLLVKAAAAGLDISSAINELGAPLPHYRFQVLVQKASELANEVKSLGTALLSALEKRDAEQLALLRSGHEVQLLKAMRQIKKENIREADENLKAVRKTRVVTDSRYQHYSKLIEDGLNAKEEKHLEKLEKAFAWQTSSQALELLAGTLSLIPQFDLGVSGISSPVVKVEAGGVQISSVVQLASRAMQLAASIESYEANKASIKGGHDRRGQEWTFQQSIAEKELEQIDLQIEAAKIRKAIAEQDQKNHETQVSNAQEAEEFMRNKYTNQELYGWMIAQLSAVYFQSYQLAYDVARRAERAFQHELGLTDTNHIQFGYWDSLKKGLLSGEKLFHDLKRMEIAYLEQNKRELEITKHVSLAQLDPVALLQLRENGSCEVEIPEVLFDLDFAGHYMRRIKSVSLTIPCVTGPYTGVNCTLTLLRHSIRATPNLSEPLQDTFGAVRSVATSSAQNDSGLFQLDFRDERYLPFERAGVVSRWLLELPRQFRQFDYDTITDAIFHFNYTARDGGAVFRSAVESELQSRLEALISEGELTGLLQMFSAKHDFPNQWHQFLHPNLDATTQTLRLELNKHRFPFMFREHTVQITGMHLFLKLERDSAFEFEGDDSLPFELTREGGAAFVDAWDVNDSPVEKVLLPYANPFGGQNHEPGTWLLEVRESEITDASLPPDLRVEIEAEDITHQRLNPEAIDDILIISQYSVI